MWIIYNVIFLKNVKRIYAGFNEANNEPLTLIDLEPFQEETNLMNFYHDVGMSLSFLSIMNSTLMNRTMIFSWININLYTYLFIYLLYLNTNYH